MSELLDLNSTKSKWDKVSRQGNKTCLNFKSGPVGAQTYNPRTADQGHVLLMSNRLVQLACFSMIIKKQQQNKLFNLSTFVTLYSEILTFIRLLICYILKKKALI